MKSLYYILGAIVLALVVIAAVFVNAPVPLAEKLKPSKEVYVDVDRLVGLHPASKMLAEIRALAGAGGARGAAVGAVSVPAPGAFSPDSFVHRPEVSRPEIEAEVAQLAVSALSRLETDQRRALQARLRATRATMMESAKSQIAAQVREIEQTAAFKQRSLTAQLGPTRLANEIRQGALSSSVRGLRKVVGATQDSVKEAQDPAFKLKQMSDELQAEGIKLQRIDNSLASEDTGIRAEARDKISALRAGSVTEIEAKLSGIESAEKAKIETEIAAARNGVLSELSSSESAPGVESFAEEAQSVRPAGAAATNRAAPPQARVLASGPTSPRGSAPAIAARIRQDVSLAVGRLAAMEGLKVTFVRSGKAAPDATARFARLLRERGAELWGPVLSAGSARLLPSGSAGASPSRSLLPSGSAGASPSLGRG